MFTALDKKKKKETIKQGYLGKKVEELEMKLCEKPMLWCRALGFEKEKKMSITEMRMQLSKK